MRNEWEEATRDLRSCYEIRNKYLYRTHTLIGECMDNFARLYNAMGKQL
jgi:hypothetical protein